MTAKLETNNKKMKEQKKKRQLKQYKNLFFKEKFSNNFLFFLSVVFI